VPLLRKLPKILGNQNPALACCRGQHIGIGYAVKPRCLRAAEIEARFPANRPAND